MKCPKCRRCDLIKLDEQETRKGVLCNVYVCVKYALSYYRAAERPSCIEMPRRHSGTVE
jgi:hypothetical protein